MYWKVISKKKTCIKHWLFEPFYTGVLRDWELNPFIKINNSVKLYLIRPKNYNKNLRELVIFMKWFIQRRSWLHIDFFRAQLFDLEITVIERLCIKISSVYACIGRMCGRRVWAIKKVRFAAPVAPASRLVMWAGNECGKCRRVSVELFKVHMCIWSFCGYCSSRSPSSS